MQGLSAREATERLVSFGPNELPSEKPRSALAQLAGALKEPMLLLLVACAGIYLALGDIREGLLLAFFVFIVIGITYFQERRSERALAALRDLSSPRALVVRDGREVRIPGRELVPDDLIVLNEGDRVPADAILVSTRHLKTDESLLTGESFPVSKTTEGRIYSGTMVVAGRGTARVAATGPKTELGRIGKALQGRDPSERTRLELETRRLVRVLGTIGIGFSILIVLVYGLTRGAWPQALLAGLAVVMSLLPEEVPVVLTVFLAMGAWRLSKRNVLTRNISATENLGSVTVLCVDKTGTLTQNRMVVKELCAGGRFLDVNEGELLPEHFHELVEYGALASHVDPFDPMERAIRETLQGKLARTEHVHLDWKLVIEYPLSHELLAMSCVWESPDQRDFVVSAKGAPEAILDLCHAGKEEQASALRDVQAMAERGLRVLAVARARFSGTGLPSRQHDFDFSLVGMIGLADPVREDVAPAIRESYDAGVRVIMMTGDYPGTASQIAEQIGLTNPREVLTGAELDSMGDDELQEQLKTVNIFARVVPEQKLRIVAALRSLGQVIAMTGDGVNDAPSLKWADVGIAMGLRGTDVAREASDLVLLDDRFSSIVAAVGLGRRIFDNIGSALAFIFAVHVPIAGMAMLPVLLKLPLVLLPAHIVFLQLVIDPACAIVFEAEEADPGIMRRPPRDLAAPLFDLRSVAVNSAQGLVVLAFVFAAFRLALPEGENQARTIAFSTLVLANLGLILLARARMSGLRVALRSKNTAFRWVLLGATAMLATTIYVGPLRELFAFAPLGPSDLLLSLLVSALATACGAVLGAAYRRNPA